jgi:hypothetical protein
MDQVLGLNADCNGAQQHPAAPQQAGAVLDHTSALWTGPSSTGFDCSLVWVTAEDGTKVPLTLISSSDAAPGASKPKAVLVLVYGAYGEVRDAYCMTNSTGCGGRPGAFGCFVPDDGMSADDCTSERLGTTQTSPVYRGAALSAVHSLL